MRKNDNLPYPMKGIRNPGKHDLLLGRGGEVNNHVGNINFRRLINEYKEQYRAASRVDKPGVAVKVVSHWRGLDPPGRFLTRSNPGEAGILWEDIGDFAAKKRASKALGERDYKSKETIRDSQSQEQASAKQNRRQEDLLRPSVTGHNDSSDLMRQTHLINTFTYASSATSGFGSSQIGTSEITDIPTFVNSQAPTTVSNQASDSFGFPRLLPSGIAASYGSTNPGSPLEHKSRGPVGRRWGANFDRISASTENTTSMNFQQLAPPPPPPPPPPPSEEQNEATDDALPPLKTQREQQNHMEVTGLGFLEAENPEGWNPGVNADTLPTAAALASDVFTSSDSSRDQDGSGSD